MAKVRTEVPEQERWNVEALYVTPKAWREEFDRVRGEEVQPHWPTLASSKGKLKDSPEAIAKFLDAYFELDRKLSKLHVYAHLRLDEDLGNDMLKENFGLISSLVHDFQLEYSWVEPELLGLAEKEYQTLLAHPKLAAYRFFLERMGRMRPHTLSTELEELLALSGKALETPHKAFGALNNADLIFKPAVDSQGKERELTTGSYQLYMHDSDRVLRKSAFENLHRGYESHANTMCELIAGQVQGHLFYATAKKFKDCREAALFPQRISSTVYDNLIATIHRNLGTMHEYMRLRKELLGLDELHVYDLHLPLVEEAKMQVNFQDACALVVDSVGVLGKEYAAALQEGLSTSRWVDPYENQRKRSGAYSSGCYDSMPYILMNYHGTLKDILTLAHEAGHSMHSFLSRKTQPYVYSGYPIFVAEVASTFNEQLLLKKLKEKASSKKEIASLINYQIEGIRSTIFRQTMFAEFELQIHRWAEEGIPLTPSLLKKAYLELNRAYYGPDLVLDAGVEVEWARIPHFYYDFYVYQYATGLSAALALFDQAMSSPKSKEGYLQFLSSGGSRYPLDLLRIAGVNLETPEPVEAAMKRFSMLVQELRQMSKEEVVR